MSELNTIFVRGTKTERVKTARLSVGRRVLTAPYTSTDPDGAQLAGPVQTKTGAVIRQVKELKFQMHRGTGFYGRSGRTYTVVFTDGTESRGHAPIYTWHALPITDERTAELVNL